MLFSDTGFHLDSSLYRYLCNYPDQMNLVFEINHSGLVPELNIENNILQVGLVKVDPVFCSGLMHSDIVYI